MFLSYCISYKAISLPLVAAVAYAAVVATAEVGGGGGGGGGGGDCGGGGGDGGDDLTRFGLRNLNFFKYCIFTIA